MVLPHAENASVDIRKLREYCLNPEHDEGKHKAALFADALGMTADAAGELREVLLRIVTSNEALPRRRDVYGQRYAVDFTLEWKGRTARLRSGWILEHGSDTPKLTTCYPL